MNNTTTAFSRFFFGSMLLLLAIARPMTSYAQPVADTLRQILDAAGNDIYGSDVGLSFGGASAALITPAGKVLTAVSGQSTPAVSLEDTLRLGASDVTQTFIATLTLALMQEGKLMLTQPVSAFSIGTLTNVPGTITIRQLLTHTSGLDDFSTDANYTSTLLFDVTRNLTAAELTQLFVGPASAPGTFRYSNTNFLVLGLILEAANGAETLQESLNRLILTPAGLSGISFYQTSDPANLVPLFADVFATGFPQQLTPNTSVFTGASFAGNLIVTPTQLVKFLQALATGKIINATNLQQMLTFAASTGRLGNQYGLGIERFTITVNGQQRNVIGHIGDINYVSLALYDSTDSVGVAIISNNALAAPQDLLNTAVNFFASYRRLRTTSIDPLILKQAQFKLYPNPISEILSVEYELLQPAQVRLRIQNVLGQNVLSTAASRQPIGKYLEQLQVASLPAGTYAIVVEIEGQIASQLFVIQ